jgi:hypothetical protein
VRVIALDPGKLWGWAAADIDDNGEWSNLEHGIMQAKVIALWLADEQGVFKPGEEWHGDAESTFDVLVYEDWVLYRAHAEEYIGSDMPYSQMIGQIRFIGWLSDTRVVKQPAARKTLALKQARAIRPELAAKIESIMARAHKDAHDGDALLHLFAWTVDNYPVRRHP